MSLVGIAKLNGLHSFAEQRGLSLEEGFEALKSQRVGSSRLALIQNWISGGLMAMASYISSSSRVQKMERGHTSPRKKQHQSRDLLTSFTITILFGLESLSNNFVFQLRRLG